MLTDTATVDVLEGKIIRCLQLAPRVPFATVAQALDVSEQTVARRYRRLVREGALRVTAVVDPAALGQRTWILRVQCRPNGALSLAQALAQREDISWVTLMSGGSEIVLILRARTSEARDDLLTQRLPRTEPVLGLTAVMVLHRFIGGGHHDNDDWAALAGLLDVDQERAILACAPPVPTGRGGLGRLHPEDDAMLAVLVEDGRASYAALAQAAGVSESRAARRLTALVDEALIYYDVDVSSPALGYHAPATLWLTVTPSELDAAGRALAAEREVAFAAAISGPQNLTATIL
ncbi:MAG: Lrp/AsnC family transcriptional regulator, partial [Jatrophihabitans sp.]